LNSTQITHAPALIEVADFEHVVQIEKIATANENQQIP
jgi:hypothetical protein